MEEENENISAVTSETKTESICKSSDERPNIKKHKGVYFTARRVAYLGLFCALSYVFYMPIFEFYIIPAVPFLKIDFSNVFVMVAAFSLGPVSGVLVGVIKEVLHALTFSQTVGVGEIANVLIMLPYVLIPSIVYKKRKGLKCVIVTLCIGCIVQTAWSVPVNYTLSFPFFLMAYAGAHEWRAGMDFYLTVWYWAVLFNFVKTVLISVGVMAIYKPLRRILKNT